MLQPKRIGHLVLNVSNNEVSTKFYTEVLGFEVALDRPGLGTFLTCGKIHHDLALFQATKDAADIFRPPQADQVAFGDALLRASDVVLSMCLVEDDSERRLIQYQKYRDAESFADTSLLHWNPNVGKIFEVNPDF